VGAERDRLVHLQRHVRGDRLDAHVDPILRGHHPAIAPKLAHASIEGTPLSLLALAGPDAEKRLRAGGIRIEGDAETAQKFRELLTLVRPDFEEELARVLGDVAAHRIASLARGLLGWGRSTADSVATNLVEFLQEEGRDLPTRVEVDEFLEGVDRLRDDAERLEARIARLETRAGRSGVGR
jgi:ubiquinone biosynthesis protein UbiJ